MRAVAAHAALARAAALLDALSAHEPEFELEEAEGFDFHDTIPAPPWLDEPLDALEAAVLPAR